MTNTNTNRFETLIQEFTAYLFDNEKLTLQDSLNCDMKYTQRECKNFIQNTIGRKLNKLEYVIMCDGILIHVKKG